MNGRKLVWKRKEMEGEMQVGWKGGKSEKWRYYGKQWRLEEREGEFGENGVAEMEIMERLWEDMRLEEWKEGRH